MYISKKQNIEQRVSEATVILPYSGLFSRHTIFAVFEVDLQCRTSKFSASKSGYCRVLVK